MKIFNNKWAKFFVFLFFLVSILFLFRIKILQAVGNYLIDEGQETFAPYTFVLGGNSYDRGVKALELFNKKLTKNIVCTGGNIPSVLIAIDTTLYEAEITKTLLVKHLVPQRNIAILTQSTSTLEESDEILDFCMKNNITKANLISSKFHLRRVRKVFEEKFKNKGITIHFIGAPSSNYDENEWWKSEEGMIMVNNEYMKLIYYWLK